jgi:membrane protein implicated in regulation of membrane protease activity
MNSIRTIFREIFGLFVDDGSFAILILAWLGLTLFLLPHLGWLPRWRGFILFAGLAAILVESTTRYSRRSRP